MKSNFALITFALLIGGCATEFKIVSSDVPQAILKAFQQKYPSAQSVEWGAEKTEDILPLKLNLKLTVSVRKLTSNLMVHS